MRGGREGGEGREGGGGWEGEGGREVVREGVREGRVGGVTDCYTYSNIIKYHHSI